MRTPARKRRSDPWVGPWLRLRREKAKTPREKIAARLGRELSAVSRIETGASSIPADDLPVVLEAYDATPLDFAREARKPREAA